MKNLVLVIIPALINVARKNVKYLAILLLMAGFCSCEQHPLLIEDDPPAIFEPYETQNVRLAKVVKYSNSTASKITGEIIYTYNEAGNLHRVSYFDEWNGTMVCIYFIEYEYSGNKKVKESYFDCDKSYPYSVVEYFYKGDLLVKEVHGDYPTFYEYDERGNLVKKYWYGTSPMNNTPDPNTIYEHKYTYDDNNKLILEETSVLDVSDYYHEYLKYIYDNYGREKKLEYYDVDNVLIGYTEKYYKGTSILEFCYDKNGKQTAKYQHFYDKWGNLTETVINDECSMFKRKYDGGLLIETIHYWAFEYGHWGTGQMPESGMSRYEYEEI